MGSSGGGRKLDRLYAAMSNWLIMQRIVVGFVIRIMHEITARNGASADRECYRMATAALSAKLQSDPRSFGYAVDSSLIVNVLSAN